MPLNRKAILEVRLLFPLSDCLKKEKPEFADNALSK